jgi:hypothetical protein
MDHNREISNRFLDPVEVLLTECPALASMPASNGYTPSMLLEKFRPFLECVDEVSLLTTLLRFYGVKTRNTVHARLRGMM